MMGRRRQIALGVAVAGLVGWAVALWLDPAAALRGWLVGHQVWLSVTLGALGLSLVHGLTGGRWGEVLAPVFLAMRGTIPLLAALFVPIVFDLGALYPWAALAGGGEAAHAELAHIELLHHRAGWMNPTGFYLRAVLAFALWIGLDHALRRTRAVAGPGLILLGFSLVFVGADWVMSVETAFYSTMIGLLLLTAAGAGGLATATLITVAGRRLPAEPKTRRDIGNLLLAMVMLTAYCAFSQFLIIWAGDLPEDNPWYLHRAAHGWSWVAVALGVLFLAAPFFALLFRPLKERARGLGAVAALLVVMHVVHAIWLITPAFGAVVPWPELAATAAIGGAWCWLFARRWRQVEGGA
ncbi:MAG: hypothetical protein R3F65_30160 [bacterium]